MSDIRKKIVNGEVAILISHGYGAGWYSWHGDEQLLFEPEIVDLVQSGAKPEDILQYCEANYGNTNYYGGIDGLRVHWIPQGMRFRVEEYDGAEHYVLEEDLVWHTA